MIRIDALEKAFGPLHVLKGVDMNLRRGRATAIVGPNASGKTTLIKAILGLVRPDAGTIYLGDQALDGDWEYRARIGYMPQAAPFPDNLTGDELLAMLQGLRREEARDRELIHAFRLEEELAKPLRTLSGGTRQKVNAVAAFLFDPEILILDEPSAGLDPVASGILKGRIERARDLGRTVLVTSHNMGELEEIADDIAFLLEGRIRFHGSLDDLRQRTGRAGLERAIAQLMLEQDEGEARVA